MSFMINRIINKIKSKVIWYHSVLHAYDYPETNDAWIKHKSPVLQSNDIYFDPYVYKLDGKYHMYVSNRTYNSIDLFESINGTSWNKMCACITGNAKGAWDEIVNRACVVKTKDSYFMFYTGQHSSCSQIGLAKSDDGQHFERYFSSPIIIPDLDIEKNSVMNPCVLWNNDRNIFQMWYSAGEFIEPDAICYAESHDGISWKKRSNPVFTHGDKEYERAKVAGCDVHYINGIYTMYYIGYQNINIGRICVADSLDGITWVRRENNPIIAPTKGAWDAHSVYKPSIIYEKDRIMLWYNGRKRYIEKIGLAHKAIKN